MTATNDDEVTRIRVLLVEDTEDDAELVLASLRSTKLEVEHARVWSRSDLNDALLQGPWDAVLCDQNMPQFDGLSALHVVRAHDADLPFIFVSGAIGEETAVAAMRNGAQDFVMKQNLRRLGAVVVREMKEACIRRSARTANRDLQAKQVMLDSIVNTAADGIAVVAPGNLVEFANQALCRMLGYAPPEIEGMSIVEVLQSSAHVTAFWESLFSPGAAVSDSPAGLQTHARARDGRLIPVEILASRMQLNGSPRATVVVRDISERTKSQEQMWRLAHFDELSGLPNRLLFKQLLEQTLFDAKRGKKSLAVFLVDLDRFKLINDTLGHDAGDDVLREVTARLRACLNDNHIIARFGGDEFAALIRDTDGASGVRADAKRVLEAIDRPYRINGEEYHLSASIGISIFPGDSADATELLGNAELAMYRAKDQGRNNFQFHSPQMNARSFEYLMLERMLRRAVEQDEFLIYYQPQVEVGSRRLIGAEALLRWKNPDLGLMQPDKFIPLAEETGLIVPIGRIVMMRACAAAKRWQDHGIADFRIAVNLSPRQFSQSELVADIRHILDESGLHPGSLELEITESMVMENPDRAAAILGELRSVGVKLAIDDFGTGYSSLGQLKRFPVDSLKIDRSFIKDVPADADDVAITHAVIAMGRSLRLSTVAEGVETEDQARFLASSGCELMQGYLISRPLPLEDMDRFLAKYCGLVIPRSHDIHA